jgi:hypothetical protein
VFVMQRDMAFAVHGISELSFAGGGGAAVRRRRRHGSIVGSLIAAGLIGWLGARARDRNSIIGVLMPFGLGLGILFLSLYNGRSANRFSLLTGQIVSVQSDQLTVLIVIGAIVLVGCCSSGARCASTRSTRSRPRAGVPTTRLVRVHDAARHRRRGRGAHHRRPPRARCWSRRRRRRCASPPAPSPCRCWPPASSRRWAASSSRSWGRCR